MGVSTRRFPMSLDSGNRLITLTVVAVCVVVLAVQVVVCRPPMTWIPLLTAALLVPIMGSCWAMAPSALAIDGDSLRIERRAWRAIHIPLRDIAALESTAGMRAFNTLALRRRRVLRHVRPHVVASRRPLLGLRDEDRTEPPPPRPRLAARARHARRPAGGRRGIAPGRRFRVARFRADRARRAGGPAKCLEFGTRPY